MRNKAVAIAKTWIGTPYHSGARKKGVGVDCGQILIAVYEEMGALQPGECNPGYYPHDRHLHRTEEKYLEWLMKYCDQVKGDPLPGDIVMFKFGKSSSHSAIVVEWPFVIHAYVRLGVIISHKDEAIFCYEDGTSRLQGVYRVKGW